MILFNKPSITEKEVLYASKALQNGKICGDGPFTKSASEKLSSILSITQPLLTTSCSHALDMTAILLNLKEGDEVIVPSYTFVSTANCIILRNATPVFVDISPDTMNIDHDKIEASITNHTKAIYVVHYAGVACEMDTICAIAKKYNIPVIEDAAQGVGAYYKGRALGSIGEMGCYSFHETKNYVMGEGGALVVNDSTYKHRAEMIREKGTDRSQFLRGEIDKYTWQDTGSSYLPSDILSAVLQAQLERFDEIMSSRLNVWNYYHAAFAQSEAAGLLRRPIVPEYAQHNAHMYYLLMPTEQKRNEIIQKMKAHSISCVFHYIPLHTSPMGEKLEYKPGQLPVTEEYASRLVRLPLYADLSEEQCKFIATTLINEL